ncbi:MAG: glycosyltransferase [Burkholderiales bacterium]|nr:glycosyltransferase [Burkholderiales bacterium]
MDVSIVVCTKNRAARLAGAFAHHVRLRSTREWEIVFVNNGSTDETAAALAGFARAAPIRVRVLDEPRRGVSAGRNTGWRAAAGSVIAFIDDDCYPAEDYVDELWKCFAEPELGYLGGRVLLYDSADYPITIKESQLREAIPPRSFIVPGVLHGANMAFRRDVLERVGGFDERMGPGTAVYGEELDIVARASAIGHPGAYDPRPAVYHHHGRSRAEEVRRIMEIYDVGRGAYFAKALADPRTRPHYLYPVARRLAGNVVHCRFAVMGRELYGAWKYLHG